MSETYRGHTLNVVNSDPEWSTIENAIFHSILNFLPQSGSILVAKEHLHTSIYDDADTTGTTAIISCGPTAGTLNTINIFNKVYVDTPASGTYAGANTAIAAPSKTISGLKLTHSNNNWHAVTDGVFIAVSGTEGNVDETPITTGGYDEATFTPMAIKIFINGVAYWIKTGHVAGD